MEVVAVQDSSGGDGGNGRRCPFDYEEMEPIGHGYFAMFEVGSVAPHTPTGRSLAVRANRCPMCGLVQLFDEITPT